MKKEAIAIVANAVIWALCIVVCANILKGTVGAVTVQLILAGGGFCSLLLLVGIFLPKKKK